MHIGGGVLDEQRRIEENVPRREPIAEDDGIEADGCVLIEPRLEVLTFCRIRREQCDPNGCETPSHPSSRKSHLIYHHQHGDISSEPSAPLRFKRFRL